MDTSFRDAHQSLMATRLRPFERGAKLLSLDAMKIQSNIYAPISEKISRLLVAPGQLVEAIDLPVVIAP